MTLDLYLCGLCGAEQRFIEGEVPDNWYPIALCWGPAWRPLSYARGHEPPTIPMETDGMVCPACATALAQAFLQVLEARGVTADDAERASQ